MTEKLYYIDSYIKEFKATVLSSEGCEEGFLTLLDRTAFFPEEGGQYSDTGEIAGVKVKRVIEKDGLIFHLTDSQLEAGKEVECKLNFLERFDKMQLHTAEHILSGVIHTLFGLDNVGFHLGPQEVTMDLSGQMTREMLSRAEAIANRAVFENRPVRAFFPSEEELSSLTYRSKLELTEDVRLVVIEDYDVCACCAPHVKFTGEVGLIKILRRESHKGGVRLWISAGERAYRDYSKLREEAEAVSAMLSAPLYEISSAVRQLSEVNSDLKAEKKRLTGLLVSSYADGIGKIEGNFVGYYPELDSEGLRELSRLALPRVSGILVLLTGEEGDLKYVISSESQNLKALCPEFNSQLLGRGGGRSDFVSGSFGKGLREIRDYFLS